MSCVVWNAQGVGNRWAFRSLHRLVKEHTPSILFVSESKVSSHVGSKWKSLLNFTGFVGVDSAGKSGGLLLFWDDSINVILRSYSPGHIDCLISYNSVYWRFTGFYGNPHAHLRRHSWDLLRKLHAQPLVGHEAWVVGGDFNEIFFQSEKQGGGIRGVTQMQAFRDVVYELELEELLAKGPRFTWLNRRQGRALVHEKLDRFLANRSWINAFPDMEAVNLEFYGSDHRPVKLYFNSRPCQHHPRAGSSFMFETKWLLEDDFLDVVTTAWNVNSNDTDLSARISQSSSSLQSWARDRIGNTGGRIKRTRDKLNRIMDKEAIVWDESEVDALEAELEKLETQEELHWRQRSRNNWLVAGDRNTIYFHNLASSRRKKNTIKSIRDDNGSWFHDLDGMAKVVERYYEELFTSSTPSLIDINQVTDAVEPCVTHAMNMILNRPFTEEDIKTAVFYLSPSKSPGPDGLPALFYQKTWDVIKETLVRDLSRILNNGAGLGEWNKTIISLIPKTKDPITMKDYRPISLCNVNYKIIARAITNRFRHVLAQIIDPSQSAFVPGRLITDNVLISYECMHWLRSTNSSIGYAALKLDLSKAYDRIEWRYLEQLMRRMGFSDSWIHLILRCVTSVSYAFKINGSIVGNVRPSRGLRQGDPLSPYLFVLCAQGLSSLIHSQVRASALRGVRIARDDPMISHLFFADDSLIFFRATKQDCKELQACLSTYEKASGQLINYDKSAITFSSKTPRHSREFIRLRLNMSVCQGHDIYLGLPTFSLRGKKMQFGYLRDRVAKKVESWTSRHFSEGGREVLIKAVLQAVPSYAMSCFRIPTSICGDIERMCNNFWWGMKAEGNRIHWCTWDELCKPKDRGDLSFRKMTLFNKALLAKQVWRFIANPNSTVARLFKARYFKDCDVMEVEVGHNPSYVWRSLCWSRDLLDPGLRWRVANGDSIRIFQDAWVPRLDSGRITSRIASGSMVSRFLATSTSWDEELICAAFLPHEAAAVLVTPICSKAGSDRRYWSHEIKGHYSVNTGYKSYWRVVNDRRDAPECSDPTTSNKWWNELWNTRVPPKVHIFLWKASQNFVATEGNLFKHHVPLSPSCFWCDADMADTVHALFTCTLVRQVWKDKGIWSVIKGFMNVSPRDLLQIIMDHSQMKLDELAITLWVYGVKDVT